MRELRWRHMGVRVVHRQGRPMTRRHNPRTALHLLGPWAPPTKTAGLRVTYSDGRAIDCDAHGLVTGEWILYLPEGRMRLTTSEGST